MSLVKPDDLLEQNKLLPPCRGKVGIGVEFWHRYASTPTLTLPLQGGGDVNGFVGMKPYLQLSGSAA
jgi:hypothetical protein